MISSFTFNSAVSSSERCEPHTGRLAARKCRACLSRFLLHVLAPAVFSGLTYAVSTGCWTSILGVILQIQSRIPWHTGFCQQERPLYRQSGSLSWSGGSSCARGCACHARNSTRVAALSVALSPICRSSSLCVRVCSSSICGR